MRKDQSPRNLVSTGLKRISRTALLACFLLTGAAAMARADGINTNNALTPARGQTILRAQLRTTRFSSESSDLEISRYVMPVLVAYGLHERLALIAVLPAVARVGFAPSSAGRKKVRDYGAGDGRVLMKARVFTRDAPGKTARIALLAGTEFPSYDSPFSSNAFDGLAGLSISFKSLDRSLDLDALYKWNTGEGEDPSVGYNLAFTQMLIQGQSLDESLWQLNAVAEINAESSIGGRHLLYLSPGLQLALPQLIVEVSVQAPILVKVAPMPEPTSSLVIGMRRIW